MVEVRNTGVSARPHSCAVEQAGALAGPVEHRGPGRDREGEQVAARVEHGDPGPRDSPAGGRGRLVPPHRGVAQARAGNVEHRPGRARWQQADGDAKIGDARHSAIVTPPEGAREPATVRRGRCPSRRGAAPTGLRSEGRATREEGALSAPEASVEQSEQKIPVPVVWSEDCLRHEPAGEVWLGVQDPGTEVPARALVLRDALSAAGAPVVPAREHDDAVLRAVHDPSLVDHLAGIWRDWSAAGLPAEYGRDRVVPYVFPTPGMLGGLPLRSPPAVHGAGRVVLLRHDDAGRAGQLGGHPGSGGRRADRGRPGQLGRAAGVRAVPAAGSPRDPGGLRGIVLPQQRRGRRAGAAGGRGAAGRRAGYRRASRQRHADDLLRPGRRLVRLAARRPGGGLVPALRRLRGRARGPGRGRAATGTCRCPRGPGTRAGWPPWTCCAARCGPGAPTPWWSRWAWTPRPATRRARCASPRTATARPAAGSRPWPRRSWFRRAGTT